jgi:hypothetical protein
MRVVYVFSFFVFDYANQESWCGVFGVELDGYQLALGGEGKKSIHT